MEQQDQQQKQPEAQKTEETKKNGETLFKSNVQRKLSSQVTEDSSKTSNGVENNNNNEKRPPIPLSAHAANVTPSTRVKMGFRDRHWTEIEKLWRGKAREPPNIESLLKPQASFRSKDRQARARTLPFSSSSSTASPMPPLPITTSTSVSHLGSSAAGARPSTPRWPPPSSNIAPRKTVVHKTVSSSPSRSLSSASMATTASLLAAHSQAVMPAMSIGRLESPLATRKAIDLLAPHVFNAWQAGEYSRMVSVDSVSLSSADSPEDEETDHFVELVKAW